MALSYGTYITKEAVEEGLKNGTLFKGTVKFSYFSKYVAKFADNSDMIFESHIDLNCALDRDLVVAKIKSQNRDQQHFVEVVHIQKKVHPRTAVGVLRHPNSNFDFTWFSDREKIIPNLKIPRVLWPKHFYYKPELYEKTLIVAEITEWTEPKKAWGKIVEVLGDCHSIHVEKLAIAKEFYLHDHAVLQFPIETQNKLDLSSSSRVESFVFSVIDPRFKSVQIAFSCEKLHTGNFEAGVHISDISSFVKKSSSLDEYIFQRASTLWLEGTAYQILPEDLRIQCSLFPNEDKPCISVFWEISPNGEVSNKRFKQTIINASALVSPFEIQNIANETEEKFEVYNGYSRNCLFSTIKQMMTVAVLLKAKRTQNTILDVIYTSAFYINKQTGTPIHMTVVEHEQRRMIFSEFSFFANFLIGDFIFEKFPHLSILRIQEDYSFEDLQEIAQVFQSAGLDIDASSAYNLKTSLKGHANKYSQHLLSVTVASFRRYQRYICSDGFPKNALFNFCLGYDIYASATSPMNTYTDIVVQSLVQSAIKESEPQWTTEEIKTIVKHCEQREALVRKAIAKCFKSYKNLFISCHQPFVKTASVFNVADNYFQAIIEDFGIKVTIYNNQVDNIDTWKAIQTDNGSCKIILTSQCSQTMIVERFKAVTISITTPRDYGTYLYCKMIPKLLFN